MKVLLMYSVDKKGELLSLATLLHSRSISFDPLQIPLDWDMDQLGEWYQHLKTHDRSIFLVNRELWQQAPFIFSVFYYLGSKDRVFAMASEAHFLPRAMRKDFFLARDFPQMVDRIWEEKNLWLKNQSQRSAINKLEKRGWENAGYFFVEAVREGDRTAVRLFLQAGYSPNYRDRKGVPVLNHAARNQHFGIVKLLVEAGADIDTQSEDRLHTALMDACSEGHGDIVDYLLNLGAGLDYQSRDGQTALILAVGQKRDDLAIKLLQKGANPEIPDKLGMSARMYAQLFQRLALNDFLG